MCSCVSPGRQKKENQSVPQPSTGPQRHSSCHTTLPVWAGSSVLTAALAGKSNPSTSLILKMWHLKIKAAPCTMEQSWPL